VGEAQVHVEVEQTSRDFAIEPPLNFENLEWQDEEGILFIGSDPRTKGIKALDPVSGFVTTRLEHIAAERLLWAAGSVLVVDEGKQLYTLKGDLIRTFRAASSVLGFLGRTLLGILPSGPGDVRLISLNDNSPDRVVDFGIGHSWDVSRGLETMTWHAESGQVAFWARWHPMGADVAQYSLFIFRGFPSAPMVGAGSVIGGMTQLRTPQKPVWSEDGQKILYYRLGVDGLSDYVVIHDVSSGQGRLVFGGWSLAKGGGFF
jgi:hypothetical protein